MSITSPIVPRLGLYLPDSYLLTKTKIFFRAHCKANTAVLSRIVIFSMIRTKYLYAHKIHNFREYCNVYFWLKTMSEGPGWADSVRVGATTCFFLRFQNFQKCSSLFFAGNRFPTLRTPENEV